MKLLKRVGEPPKGLDGCGRWRRLMGMKQILVIMAAVVLVGCFNDTRKTAPKKSPLAIKNIIADPIVEKAIRKSLKKPEGALTEADLGNVIELILADTQITDEGLKEVVKLQNLRVLSLIDTQITDAGLKDVAKLKNLEGLYLRRTKVTDAGLKEVAKLQNLQIIALLETKYTKTGVAELKKALPNTAIWAPNPPDETP